MSKTRSGLCYKEDDTKYTMVELKVQELLQMLIEDRTKREVEIAEDLERERREKSLMQRGKEETKKEKQQNEKARRDWTRCRLTWTTY